jgi:hypothetical protein
MTPHAPSTPAPTGFVQALPWIVLVGGVLTLMPLVFSPILLVAHLPTFSALWVQASGFARRARGGERSSPVALAAVGSGLIASVGLMLVPILAMGEDPLSGVIYWFTWILLPIFALVASGLVAALVALGRFVFCRRSTA